MSMLNQDHAGPSAAEAEALIQEARRLPAAAPPPGRPCRFADRGRRRRRRRVCRVRRRLVVALHHRATSRAASPSQIRAFLAQAERGVTGTFSVTYAVTVRNHGGSSRHVDVAAAQRSPAVLFYRETPSLSVSSPAGPLAKRELRGFPRRRR